MLKLWQKTVIVLGLIAFITCLALLIFGRKNPDQPDVDPKVQPIWKPCSGSNIQIKSVEVPECDRSLMKERCALHGESDFIAKVRFVQGELEINNSYEEIEYSPDSSEWSSSFSCLTDLECPGWPGRDQHYTFMGRLGNGPPGVTNITMKLMIGENDNSGRGGPYHLCVEVPTFIVK